jgi:FMN phosphatase YigB (HAD superfamily)
MVASKSLLLDIDGVLVRDRELMTHVTSKCVSYVRSKLPECKDPAETNRVLYLSHGHTARGLEKVFGIDTRDFNARVYDKKLIGHLADILAAEQFQAEAAEIHSLTKQGWKLRLFTNAPWIWASKVALAIGDDVSVRCPGNPCESALKPEIESYMFSFDDLNVLVDDSLKNLGTARYLPGWKCIHFTDGPKDNALWCPQVSSIKEIVTNLSSLDT